MAASQTDSREGLAASAPTQDGDEALAEVEVDRAEPLTARPEGEDAIRGEALAPAEMGVREPPSGLIAPLLDAVAAVEASEAAAGAVDMPVWPTSPQPLPVASSLLVWVAGLPELAGLGTSMAHGGGASFFSFDAGSIAGALDPLLGPTEALATGMARGAASGFARFGVEPVADDAARSAPREPSGPADSRDEAAALGTGANTASPVVPTNDAPETDAASASGLEDAASIAVTLSGSDVDGTVESFSLNTLPVNGTLYTDAGLTVLAATSTDYAASEESLTLYFVPTANFNGSASFTYAAKDGAGAADATPATASITVTPVNDAPVASDDSAATDENAPVTVTVLANDSDPDGDPLVVASVTQGANGTVAINPDGTVTYTPDADFDGSDSFTYTASDGEGGSATATVTVTVYNVVEGTSGDDAITGTAGRDKLLGLEGDDLLSGGNGHDILFGGAGDDTLSGENGDDTLFGEDGADNLFGGTGTDILVWDSLDATIDGGKGSDTLRVESGDVDLTAFAGTILGIEKIDLASDGDPNTLTLTAQNVLDISDNGTLTVLGEGGDRVDAGTGWADGGFDGNGNHVFTQAVGATVATLIVDPDISTNPDITA